MSRNNFMEALTHHAHQMAQRKGWWDDCRITSSDVGKLLNRIEVPPTVQAAKLALIHSEVSEALECVRDGDLSFRFAENGKPEGLPSELADIVIRVADLCGALDIDLAEAIAKKMAYNETRTHRHGGRLL